MDNFRFILQPVIRQLLATGNKRVKLRYGIVVELPCIRRKKSREQIYEKYAEHKRANPEPSSLGRTRFVEVYGVVTSDKQKWSTS